MRRIQILAFTFAIFFAMLTPLTSASAAIPQEFFTGTTTEVDNRALTIENNVLRGISQEERIRLWNEAEKHNTPIILDLSETTITEVADNAIVDTPIMRVILPSTLTKIGANGFANNLIRQIFFIQSVPGQIGKDAFKQLEADTYPFGIPEGTGTPQNGTAHIASLSTPDNPVRKSVSPNFDITLRLPGTPNEAGQVLLEKQANPYLIAVVEPNGQAIGGAWGVFTSKNNVRFNNLTPKPFIDYNENQIQTPTANTVSYTDEGPTSYAVRFDANQDGRPDVELTGSHYITFRLTRFVDVSPSPEDPETPSPRAVLHSVGLHPSDPITHASLAEQGWEVVDMHNLYGKDVAWGEAQYVELVKRFGAFDSSPGVAAFMTNLTDKHHDVITVAQPRDVTYRYYDTENGELVGKDQVTKSYVNFPLPERQIPDGYELVIDDLIRPNDRVKGNSENWWNIPIRKKNTEPEKVTVSIQLLNEDGVRLGENFVVTGNKGDALTLPEETAKFLTDKNYKLLNPDFQDTFDKDKIIPLTVKGHVVGVPGTNGKDGKNGKDGVNGRNGSVTVISRHRPSGTYNIGINGKDGKDGKDGATPTIDKNGNWVIDGKNTGKKAYASLSDKEIAEHVAKAIKENCSNCGKSSCSIWAPWGNLFGCWWPWWWLFFLTLFSIFMFFNYRRRTNKLKDRLEELEELIKQK